LTRVRVGGQINPSKSKLKQAKKLAFPWISLADSGLFNGLQRIQIKKSFLLDSLFPSVRRDRIRSSVRSRIAQISDLRKTMLDYNIRRRRPTCRGSLSSWTWPSTPRWRTANTITPLLRPGMNGLVAVEKAHRRHGSQKTGVRRI
jgi:hypothetical protein